MIHPDSVLYPALLEVTETGVGVTFPDLPGCIAFGATDEVALLNAETALGLHVGAMVRHGEALPQATPLHDLRGQGQPTTIVKAAISGKVLRINVSIDEASLAVIDQAANRLRLSRSAFLAKAAKDAAIPVLAQRSTAS